MNLRRFTPFTYRIALLSLGVGLLGSCSRAHQLGMEENPEEILDRKLNNPQAELTPNQSITLLNHCAELGEQNAATAAEKTVSIFAGNTGAGKSTTLNALLGCQMKAVRPRELGLPGAKRIVVVDPESPREEVMPIGHGDISRTFMPQIVHVPDDLNSAYCDCPGFSDNRGAEINIANAINIRKILQQATGVKAVFLTDYHGLLVDRGSSIRNVENMCKKMFGGADNLRRYQNSVLLGITKAPLCEDGEPLTRNTVCEVLRGANSDIATILANRIFLFDPLDRATDNLDFWHREQLRTVISQLRHIPQQQAKNLFQTTLTDSDQVHLLTTVRRLQPKIVNAIRLDDVTALGQHWQLIQRLHVIEHPEVNQLIEGQVLSAINNAILQRVDTLKGSANIFNFDDAQQQLTRLTRIKNNLPGVTLSLNIGALNQHLARCREAYTEQKRREAELRRLNEEQQRREAERARLEAEREELERRHRRVRLPFPYNLFLP